MDKSDTRSELNDCSKNVDITPAKKEKIIKWSPENEAIMVEWCDIAQCYKWLNTKAHAKLSFAHAWFTIPAITLSTVTGTASFAQSSLPEYAPAIIGSINIFIGILSTIQQYLKISERNEAHRVSAISWDKFARNIRIELAKDPNERTEAGHFIRFSRMEFDRMMETSPAISQNIVSEFTSTFSGKPGSVERSRFDALRKPDICNTIRTANDYRHHWYKDISPNNIHIDIMPAEQETDLSNTEDHEKLQKCVDTFVEQAGRKPHIDELSAIMKNCVHKDAIEAFRPILGS